MTDNNKSPENILPTKDQLETAFNLLKELVSKDMTFVHCVASMERSPLLCIMFVMTQIPIIYILILSQT